MYTVARFLPLLGVTLFLLVGFVWRAWLHRRRHGQLGIILFRPGNARQHVRDALFLTLIVAAVAQAGMAAVSPATLAHAHWLPLPGGALSLAGGAFLLLGGTLLMAAAQLDLGASWRIGIDKDAKPGLVTHGPYRFCRNPIFLGMFVALAGLVVLLPTYVSAAVLAGAVLCVRAQVIEEEAYLIASYGDAYRAYASHVGRFLPGLGTRGLDDEREVAPATPPAPSTRCRCATSPPVDARTEGK